jgi:hypothetical protein
MANLINWVEMPVNDIDRAVKFYSEVLNSLIQQQVMMGIKTDFFNMEGDGVGVSICSCKGYEPLNGGEDLSEPHSRVESAGGIIVMLKTKINDKIGYMAMFIDSEGNNIEFHPTK